VRYTEAPTEFDGTGKALFLAGGISDCPDWQTEVATTVQDLDVTVLNPRRAAFPLNDPHAEAEQVAWEYRHLRLATHVVFWFPASPSSHQPIALYELGMLAADLGKPLAVGADPGYIRRNNLVAQLSHARPALTVRSTLEATIADVRAILAGSENP
jgi:hypothetical protein